MSQLHKLCVLLFSFVSFFGRKVCAIKPNFTPDPHLLAHCLSILAASHWRWRCSQLLQVYGKSAGGDANELRLKSTSDKYINVRAHGGSLDFVSTKVNLVLLLNVDGYIVPVPR